MKFYSRRVIKPNDLNPSNVLFGGALLSWIDEEAAIFAACQMKTQRLVTKFISEINFTSSARSGDVIEFGLSVAHVGRTSLTVKCVVRNKVTHESIIEIDKMVFVAMSEEGVPEPHGAATESVAA
ncbi:acyl-CoA thioesterase [Aestuariicella sp. G3-2]|uniref:acyl-CoA thioesterase n=1 Tax=Pseudomaricurvus albidus TaxID=2842452 RepID=UPI001C0ACD59|nr:hotdog domain-containing protein [Aestuariicella albida]MBU3071507.1 acyl-CoA thioesterase [Aestuariicella albida]